MWVLVLAFGCGDNESGGHDPIDDDGDGVVLGTDCDDGDGEVHPGADERCNAIDDDCDGSVDEEPVDPIAVFADADADGYGGEADGTACEPGADQAAEGGDCDDADPGAHPGATEICNGGVDDDCDGAADDDDDSTTGVTDWYGDEDKDGYGGGTPVSSCASVPDSSTDGSDCNDVDASVHPGADELCNGVDDDCDPLTSESGTVWRGGILYWTIQEAIDDSFDGDLVEICSGTFLENLVVDKAIELVGVSSEVSIVDGSGAERSVISVTQPNALLTIRRLTIQNGVSATEAGGIAAESGGDLVVEDSVVVHNTGYRAGGIQGPEHGASSILRTIVSDNASDTSGGGVYLYNDGTGDLTEVRDSEITDNTCGAFGGGLAIFESVVGRLQAVASISDTLVDGNAAVASSSLTSGYGGGIFSDADLTIVGLTVSNNRASDRGGGIYMGAAAMADDKTLVTGNTSDDAGGGIYISGDPWQYGRIENNTAAVGGGLAFGISGAVARDVVVEANTATTAGGGVSMARLGEVHDSQILSNVSKGGGGGIYATDTSSSYDALVADCTIEGNVSATEGGGALVIGMGFQSISSDWGTGATDNAPDDLGFYATDDSDPVTLTDLETAEDFLCDTEDAVCE